MVSLIVVCGLPGSGKTTIARELAVTTPAYRFNADEWMGALGTNLWDAPVRDRGETLQWRVAQELLTLGTSVVIEWGTWSRAERDALRAGAHDLGVRSELCVVDAPDEELCRRISARGLEDPPITQDQIIQWRMLFERPSTDELALFDYVH